MPAGDWLDGLDATPWEREQVAEAWTRSRTREPAAGTGRTSLDGSWHDFEAAASQLDRLHELDGIRRAEDIAAQLDRRLSAENKLVRAMRRIEAGTYTEPSRRDPLGRDKAACDGQLDDFGRYASRFHDRDCHVVVEGSAATGDADAAQAWRDTMARYMLSPEALGLSTPAEPWVGEDMWSDMLRDPALDPGLHAAVLAYLGEPGGAAPGPALPAQRRPEVSGVRAVLGL